MKILISACLLGTPCRYDGRSKRHPLIDTLAQKHELIPVCPEVLGGLPTPRDASERVGDRVVMQGGRDVTENYRIGAEAALAIFMENGCSLALLKARSPSCGDREIYDGTFSHTLTPRSGVTAGLLLRNGITVLCEDDIPALL